MTFALAIAPLLSTLAFTAEAACTDPSLKASAGSSGLTTNQNFGIYDWDDSTQAWVLDQAGYAAFAESETLQPGDISIPATVFGGGSGGGGGGGGGGTQVELQADELPTDAHRGSSKTGTSSLCGEPFLMPATVVTGFQPTGSFVFFRFSIFRAIGGSFGIGRPTPALRSKWGDISCTDEVDVRLNNARGTLGLWAPNLFRAGQTFTVIYANGQRETWRITSPASTVGAIPVGGCG